MGEPTLMKINKTTYKEEASILESAKAVLLENMTCKMMSNLKENGTLIYLPYEKSFKL